MDVLGVFQVPRLPGATSVRIYTSVCENIRLRRCDSTLPTKLIQVGKAGLPLKSFRWYASEIWCICRIRNSQIAKAHSHGHYPYSISLVSGMTSQGIGLSLEAAANSCLHLQHRRDRIITKGLGAQMLMPCMQALLLTGTTPRMRRVIGLRNYVHQACGTIPIPTLSVRRRGQAGNKIFPLKWL